MDPVHRSPTASRGSGVDAPCVVYLHVGAPKTGTTFLQDVLWRNREALRADGVLYPAERHGDHFHAALDLRGVRFHGYDNPAVPGAWDRIVARVHNWRGRVAVISHEMLAWATEEQARQAVESLQPAQVHIVYTARDLVRQAPAAWQESVKNRRVVTFQRYLRSLEIPEKAGPLGRVFWGAQDAVDVLRRWGMAVPAGRIHVVTVPPLSGSGGLLWQRFAEVVGVDPARCSTDVGSSNVSLGRTEVELMRRVNRAIGDDVDWPAYERRFKRGLAETTLAGRSGAEKVTLPERWRPWAREQSERIVSGLREAGYDVVGDLEDLLSQQTEEAPGEPAPSSPPSPDAVLDLAAETIARLIVEGPSQQSAAPPSWRRLAWAAYRRGSRAMQEMRVLRRSG